VEQNRPRLLLITSELPVRRTRPQPPPSDAPRPSSAVKRQAEALQAFGLSVEIFAFRGRSLYNYAAAWTRLRPRLDEARYDLVHAQEVSNALLALPKRLPLVVTVGKRRRRALHQLLARFLAGRADAVIVPSADIGRRLHTHRPVYVIAPESDEQALTERLLDVYRSVLPFSLS
jgi:hypothetical protein